jgi:anti-sigma regulatory factor (Ser/Thr protein kinase)
MARTPDSVHIVVPEQMTNDAVRYISFMGFFRMLGVQGFETQPNVGVPSRYLPITTITRGELGSHASGLELAKAIEDRAKHLATVLSGRNETKVNVPIAYCLQEVIRNVFEHAEVDECSLLAQRWDKADSTEIAIVDKGIGVRKSLQRKYTFGSNVEYLTEALKPGVSSKDIDTESVNAGFGLYVLSRLAIRTGEFLLCSGDCGIQNRDGRIARVNYAFDGTAIKLRVTRPRGVNLPQLMQEIIDAGNTSLKKDVATTSLSRYIPQ